MRTTLAGTAHSAHGRLALGLTLACLIVAPVKGTVVPGTLPGDLGVDQTGAAVYRIPLDLPPGIAGLEPELALAYHSRSGEGLHRGPGRIGL